MATVPRSDRELAHGENSDEDLLPGVRSRDISPDDIWYSRKAKIFLKDVPLPRIEKLEKRLVSIQEQGDQLRAEL